MKVSEAIKALADVLREAGDLEVVGLVGVDGQWAVDMGRTFDVVGIPLAVGDGEELVCAFIAQELVCECEEEVEGRPRLALVKREDPDVGD